MPEKTLIEIGGLTLLEPVTALTDFVISLFCIVFYLRLKKNTVRQELRKRWNRFYISLGLSTLLGGIAHLLYFYLEGLPHQVLWLGMNLLSAVAIYFAELSSIELLFKGQIRTTLRIFSSVLLVLFSGLSLYLMDFTIVKINILLGVLFILYVHITAYRKQIKGSGFVIVGMLVSCIPVVIHSLKISLGRWFNYNDISHTFMMLSLYLIFLGVFVKTEEKNLSAETI